MKTKVKISQCSRLYRLLSRQGYFKKSGKEPAPFYKITIKGMRALYLLNQHVVLERYKWEEVMRVALDPKYTGASLAKAEKDSAAAINLISGGMMKLKDLKK